MKTKGKIENSLYTSQGNPNLENSVCE